MKSYQDEVREYVDSPQGQSDPRVDELNAEVNKLINQRAHYLIGKSLFWQRVNDAVYRFAKKVGII